MPELTPAQIGEVRADIMRRFSETNLETPVTKQQLSALLNLIDGEIDSAEGAIVSAIPDGPEKLWLLANPTISRRLVTRIADKRREVL